MFDLTVMTLFPALLAIAAVGDLLTFRIPNWISISLVLLFALSAVLGGLPIYAIALHVAVGLALLIVGMALFAMGVAGGGDAKLLGAAGLWMGWGALPAYLVSTALAGGLLALCILSFRKLPLDDARLAGWARRLHGKNEGVPYGIALALGALVAFPQTVWFAAATSGS